jgi:hypothetical protein
MDTLSISSTHVSLNGRKERIVGLGDDGGNKPIPAYYYEGAKGKKPKEIPGTSHPFGRAKWMIGSLRHFDSISIELPIQSPELAGTLLGIQDLDVRTVILLVSPGSSSFPVSFIPQGCTLELRGNARDLAEFLGGGGAGGLHPIAGMMNISRLVVKVLGEEESPGSGFVHPIAQALCVLVQRRQLVSLTLDTTGCGRTGLHHHLLRMIRSSGCGGGTSAETALPKLTLRMRDTPPPLLSALAGVFHRGITVYWWGILDHVLVDRILEQHHALRSMLVAADATQLNDLPGSQLLSDLIALLGVSATVGDAKAVFYNMAEPCFLSRAREVRERLNAAEVDAFLLGGKGGGKGKVFFSGFSDVLRCRLLSES